MDDTPNEETTHFVDENGEMKGMVERITRVQVTDHEGKFVENLYVGDCKMYSDIHRKTYECLWQHYTAHGFTTPQIVQVLEAQYRDAVDQTSLKKFLEQKLLDN